MVGTIDVGRHENHHHHVFGGKVHGSDVYVVWTLEAEVEAYDHDCVGHDYASDHANDRCLGKQTEEESDCENESGNASPSQNEVRRSAYAPLENESVSDVRVYERVPPENVNVSERPVDALREKAAVSGCANEMWVNELPHGRLLGYGHGHASCAGQDGSGPRVNESARGLLEHVNDHASESVHPDDTISQR